MARVELDIPASVKQALNAEAARTNRSQEAVILAALADYLDLSVHTVFQISTTGALVAGVEDREISVATLLEHGNFGLGTFAGLDGEMVVLDGVAYQALSSGEVRQATPDAGVPFAVVTRFAADQTVMSDPIASFSGLEAQCDLLRTSDNLFYAVRLDGVFKRIKVRVATPPPPGGGLMAAAKAQSEFVFSDIPGTLVGIWSPVFSSQFSVQGYHFHFLSDDRAHGGHVLDVEAEPVRLQMETLNDFRLALPETASFLKADLSRNIAEDLAAAEKDH